jgi:hypothetical protein
MRFYGHTCSATARDVRKQGTAPVKGQDLTCGLSRGTTWIRREKSLDVDFAILAPVPMEHLESGRGVAAKEGFVAFGSMKWEFFRRVDELRHGRKVPVLLYPSHEDVPAKLSYLVAWFGWYTGHVDSVGGAHPLGMRHRPPTTGQYNSDNIGHWAVFWHVAGLRKWPKERHRPISEIETVKGGWRMNAPPRGPELVAAPYDLSNEECRGNHASQVPHQSRGAVERDQ